MADGFANGFDPTEINMFVKNLPGKVFDRKFMVQLGLDSIADISERVQQHGLGVDDAPMKPYTAAYAKQRAKGFKKKWSRRGMSRNSGPPKPTYQVQYRDLTVKGQMMANINVLKSNSLMCTIGFKSHQEELKAQGNDKVSPWFGLTVREKQKALDRVEKHIKTVVG